MAEPKKPDLQDPPKKSPFSVKGKSFREIAVEGNKRVREDKPLDDVPAKAEDKKIDDVKSDDKPPKDNKVEKEAEALKEQKRTAETVAKVTREETERVLKEKEEREKREIDDAERQKKLKDASLPPWQRDPEHHKNAKGEVAPQSWDELFESSKEAAKAEIREELRLEREKEAADRKAKEEADTQTKTQTEAQQKAIEESISKQITDEYNDLVTSGKLPKIVDEKNKEDEGVIARDALFKKGTEVNADRIAKGLSPIASPKIIFYEHYKTPAKQPAGADAPIAGNDGVAIEESPKIDYGQIRAKSYRQIIAEGMARAKRALGQSK